MILSRPMMKYISTESAQVHGWMGDGMATASCGKQTAAPTRDLGSRDDVMDKAPKYVSIDCDFILFTSELKLPEHKTHINTVYSIPLDLSPDIGYVMSVM